MKHIEQARALNVAAWKLKDNNPKEAESLAGKALTLLSKPSAVLYQETKFYKEERARSLHIKGYCKNVAADYQAALRDMQEALNLYQSLHYNTHQSGDVQQTKELEHRFFSNLSYELRTPLTLITAPLEDLIRQEKNKGRRQNLDTVLQNARRMQTLMDDLLDLAKADSGNLKVLASFGDLSAFLKNVCRSFISVAAKQQINFAVDCEAKKVAAYFDTDKIEKVIVRLLNHAFRFTRKGGIISVKLSVKKDVAHITMHDNGMEIAAAVLPHLFNRFYQADNPHGRQGTGIDLAYAKELVTCCHGTLDVQSRPKKGTTFTIRLPISRAVFKPDEVDVKAVQPKPKAAKEKPVTASDEAADQPLPKTAPVVLLVDDSTEIRAYLRKQLQKTYRIEEAKTGKDGLQKAIAFVPDIVILDVMMPEMNGYELCATLKTTEATSHIPIIMLTAKSSAESKLYGYEQGADAYLPKPFNLQELQVQIKNFMTLREKMQKRFVTAFRLQHSDDEAVASKASEEEFLSKLKNSIARNLSNDRYGIKAFERDAALSHVQLYRKLKALTGLSASEFIQTVRLQVAAEHLKKNAGNVSEIAYQVGFRNQTYFSSCFKKQFHMTPNQFRNEYLTSR